MLPLNVTLSYYKRRDIQEEIIKAAQNREVAVKYNDTFGNRPDVLNNPNDILELAKQKATSFHCSEELWSNALQLSPNMKKHEIDNLKIGWDLILDIDCPMWELSKITTWLIIKSLREHNVKSISLKFSGNKGFHIGVPFEAFPIKINELHIKDLFPYLPQKVALYLLDYIGTNHIEIENEKIIFDKELKNSLLLKDIIKSTGKTLNELITKYCSSCKSIIKDDKKMEDTLCRYCGSILVAKEAFMECPKCKKTESLMSKTCKCGSDKYFKKFDVSLLINIDTILISSRHLFRMPYSLHESSGLVSIPLDPNKILEFNKNYAKPENIKISEFRFLNRDHVINGEARKLILQTLDFAQTKEDERKIETKKDYEVKDAIPEQFFPPCIKLISKGLSDGRKRALFILINFLSSLGWGYDDIEKYLKEWNKKNVEPLRENYLVGQLRYHKSQKKKILPANCNNMMYYVNIGVCRPDNLCSKIKNPVSYSIRKSFFALKEEKGKGASSNNSIYS